MASPGSNTVLHFGRPVTSRTLNTAETIWSHQRQWSNDDADRPHSFVIALQSRAFNVTFTAQP